MTTPPAFLILLLFGGLIAVLILLGWMRAVREFTYRHRLPRQMMMPLGHRMWWWYSLLGFTVQFTFVYAIFLYMDTIDDGFIADWFVNLVAFILMAGFLLIWIWAMNYLPYMLARYVLHADDNGLRIVDRWRRREVFAVRWISRHNIDASYYYKKYHKKGNVGPASSGAIQWPMIAFEIHQADDSVRLVVQKPDSNRPHNLVHRKTSLLERRHFVYHTRNRKPMFDYMMARYAETK